MTEQSLSHGALVISLQGRDNHLLDEETDSGRLNNLPQVTQLVSSDLNSSHSDPSRNTLAGLPSNFFCVQKFSSKNLSSLRSFHAKLKSRKKISHLKIDLAEKA